MKAFLNSERSIRKFKLTLHPDNKNTWSNVANLPFIHNKIISLKNFTKFKSSNDFQEVSKVVINISDLIEHLEISNTSIATLDELCNIIKHMTKIRTITLHRCYSNKIIFNPLPQLPLLKTVSFMDSYDSFFDIFWSQKSIETLVVSRTHWCNMNIEYSFDQLAATLPKLRRILMSGEKTVNYFQYGRFLHITEKAD